MTDDQALALCAFQEANLEPDAGVAAVVRVVLNRTELKYSSDGTVQGTIFMRDQFSWTQFAMVDGIYSKVAHTPQEVQLRAESLLNQATAYHSAWARCQGIAARVQSGTFADPAYDLLTDETVLYYNPAIVADTPAWAIPANLVATIGHHSFFKD